MTHDDPESPLKPQVIDLEAEDVIMEETRASETSQPPPPPPKKSGFPTAWLAIAALGGASCRRLALQGCSVILPAKQ